MTTLPFRINNEYGSLGGRAGWFEHLHIILEAKGALLQVCENRNNGRRWPVEWERREAAQAVNLFVIISWPPQQT